MIKRFTSGTTAARNFIGAGASKVSTGIKSIKPSGFKMGLLKMGGLMGGMLALNAFAATQKQIPPIPPGASISTGKRGIDSNNLNASGVGLSMYRNRRR